MISLEAYYDDTVEPGFGWSELISQPEPWNSDPSQGYKIDLALVDYEILTQEGISQVYTTQGGYYVAYSEYITAPNTWVTLTFDTKDAERFESFTAAQVTGLVIVPAAGYDQSANPLYIRNLKIVEAD